MSHPALPPQEMDMMAGVFRKHAAISCVKLFGSRAKGTHQPHSDVDLAVWGNLDAIRAAAIAAELDELPLPYRFEVQAFGSIKLAALREHIERVGIQIYPETDGGPEPSAGSGRSQPKEELG